MENNSVNSVALRNGFLAGLAGIIIMLVLYVIDPVHVTGFLPMLVYPVVIALMVMAGLYQKKIQNGFITFKEALRTIFIVAVVSSILMAVFNYVLFEFIDPTLPEVLKEETINRTIGMMEKFGAPESSIEETMEKLESQEFNPTWTQRFLGLLGSFVIGFIVSSICALIIRKNPPEHMEMDVA